MNFCMIMVILELIPSFLFSDFMEDSRNAKEHERTLRNAKESFGQGSGAISYKKHINAVHLKLKTFQCEKCQKTPKLEN